MPLVAIKHLSVNGASFVVSLEIIPYPWLILVSQATNIIPGNPIA